MNGSNLATEDTDPSAPRRTKLRVTPAAAFVLTFEGHGVEGRVREHLRRAQIVPLLASAFGRKPLMLALTPEDAGRLLDWCRSAGIAPRDPSTRSEGI